MRHDKHCITIHNVGNCPDPQKTKSTHKEPQIPQFQLDPEVHLRLVEAGQQLGAEVAKAQARMVEAVTDMMCDLTNALKAQREAQEAPASKPEAEFPSAEKLTAMVGEFRDAWEGKFADTSGVYGPQSCDLIAEYVRYLTRSDDWKFPEIYAGTFGNTEDPHILKHFTLLELHTGPALPGDIVVAASNDGYGYIGVITKAQLGKTLEIFTQSPIFPAGYFPVKRESVIGVWRPRTSNV